ncbi:hypothetical protein PIB30_045201 [Stylosanthes scabra]|uniref:Uncharacterized protein n=1 Tax=Stylosanthes scabra TaxID=79078 RepID=A0ABU6QGU6_9FABA|nr:hypothetical protein [Stylosanthes scabra]
MWIAYWESQKSIEGGTSTPKPNINPLSQVSSAVEAAIARYSDSAEERDTVSCFLDLQDINESPMKMQYPVTLLLVLGHHVESESTYGISRNQTWRRRANLDQPCLSSNEGGGLRHFDAKCWGAPF